MGGDIQETYLQEARQADERADRSTDPGTAALWRRIAEKFRALAANLDEARHHRWT
jgi:hypothetical protein